MVRISFLHSGKRASLLFIKTSSDDADAHRPKTECLMRYDNSGFFPFENFAYINLWNRFHAIEFSLVLQEVELEQLCWLTVTLSSEDGKLHPRKAACRPKCKHLL